jgi:hypothetical protein
VDVAKKCVAHILHDKLLYLSTTDNQGLWNVDLGQMHDLSQKDATAERKLSQGSTV